MERIHFLHRLPRRDEREAARAAIDVPVPIVGRDPGIVPRNDIVHPGFPFIPLIGVPRADFREAHVGLKATDADFLRKQVQGIHGPRVPVEDAKAVAKGAGARLKGLRPVIGKEALELPVEREHAHVVREHLFKQQIGGEAGEIGGRPSDGGIPRAIFLVRHVPGDRQNVSGRPVIGPARVVAGVDFIVQQVPLQPARVHQAAGGVRAPACPREDRRDVHEVRAEGMDLAEEHRAIGPTIEPRLAPCRAIGPIGEVAAEVLRKEGSPEAVEGGMVVRPVQLPTLARHQGASNPEIEHLVELKLPDRIQQADVGVAAKMIGAPPNVAVETFGVEGEPDILVDLPVDVDPGIVHFEVIAVMAPRCALDRVETAADPHPDRDPFVVIRLNRATSKGTGHRGSHSSHQRRDGSSNYKLFPPPFEMSLHTDALPCE